MESEKKEPIIFKVKSGGPVKNMNKIMNQLMKAKRPVILHFENYLSVGPKVDFITIKKTMSSDPITGQILNDK